MLSLSLSLCHSQGELKEKIAHLESQGSSVESQLQSQKEGVEKDMQEKEETYKETIRQHSVTICAMEERLNKVVKKNKDYQAEITQLRQTISGKRSRDVLIRLMFVVCC